MQFNGIDTLDREPDFSECVERVSGFLRSLGKPSTKGRRRG